MSVIRQIGCINKLTSQFQQIGLVLQKQWGWYVIFLCLFSTLSIFTSFMIDCLCPLHFQVAASHLDTVLEKLKGILDNVGKSIFRRFLLLFECHICIYLLVFLAWFSVHVPLSSPMPKTSQPPLFQSFLFFSYYADYFTIIPCFSIVIKCSPTDH